MKKLYFLVLVFLLPSCVREKIIDTEDFYKKEPVVYCIITPGENIHVNVSETLPFGYSGHEIPVVEDATVRIKGNGITQEIPYHQQGKHYIISKDEFKIENGQQYFLEVFLSNGTKVSATTTVPITPPVWHSIDYKVIEKSLDGDEPAKLIEFNFLWKNDGEADCSYFIYSKDAIQGIGNGTHYIARNEDYSGPIYRAYYLRGGYESFIALGKATFSLIKANADIKKMYEFESQLRLVNDQLDMGLFWELYRGIIPEYSNINGGYGFFGSYLKTDTTIKIEP